MSNPTRRRTPVQTTTLSTLLRDRCGIALHPGIAPEIRDLRVILPEVCHSLREARRERYDADLVWSQSHEELYNVRSSFAFHMLSPTTLFMVNKCLKQWVERQFTRPTVKPATSLPRQQQKRGGGTTIQKTTQQQQSLLPLPPQKQQQQQSLLPLPPQKQQQRKQSVLSRPSQKQQQQKRKPQGQK